MPQLGDYVYQPDWGFFTAVQRVLHVNQLHSKYPLITATNNPYYQSIFKEDL
jgi:hypothetical protein